MNQLLRRILATVFVLGCVATGQSQTADTEKLIANSWMLSKYTRNGEMLPPPAGHEKDKLNLYVDHTFYNESEQDEGTWKYDAEKKILTVSGQMTIDFRVIEIAPDSCILEAENPGDKSILRLFLKAAPKE